MFELILVNDGSNDNSVEICNEYADKYQNIRIINKINGGVSSARNIGIENSIGNWITFVDADDIITPDYLEVLYNNVVKTNTDFCMAGCMISQNGFIKRHVSPDNESFIGSDQFSIFLNKYIDTPIIKVNLSKLYKRSILNKYNIRFDVKLKVAEDALFVLEYLTKIESASTVPNSIYNYQNPPDLDNKYPLTLEEIVYKCSRTESQLIYLSNTYNCNISDRNNRNWCNSIGHLPYLDFIKEQNYNQVCEIIHSHGFCDVQKINDQCNLYLRSLKVINGINTSSDIRNQAIDIASKCCKAIDYTITNAHPITYKYIDFVIRHRSPIALKILIYLLTHRKQS